MDLRTLLETHLQDPETGWSMGTFGALAEFHQEAGEPVERDEPARLTRATSRGAIRLEPGAPARPVAYETLSSRSHRWGHGVALCLPEGEALMSRRSTVTELGPDTDAIRDRDRDGILFDMGLGATGAACRQVDFCVRTDAPELIETLRRATGQSIFAPGCAAMAAILEAHPNRVALTRLGRVEVYQPIGGPATGGKSPAGPHTHVLPKLLASGRTHSANTPIPDGLLPCAALYPANPVSTPLGRDKPFDAAQHEAFQALLESFGVAAYVATKRRLRAAIAAGREPSGFEVEGGRLARVAVRIALRQLDRDAAGEAERALIRLWRDAFDTSAVRQDPIEAEHG